MSPAGHSSDAFRDRRVTPEAPAVWKEPRLRGRRAGRRTAGRPCARRAQSPPRLGSGGRRRVRSGPRREDRGGVGRHVEGEADAARLWGGQCPGRRRRDRASPPGERSGFHRAAACAPPPAPRAPRRGPDVRAAAGPTCAPPLTPLYGAEPKPEEGWSLVQVTWLSGQSQDSSSFQLTVLVPASLRQTPRRLKHYKTLYLARKKRLTPVLRAYFTLI